ncbi:MAG TPA: polysaccharide deacetylase family protein [Steroidobacteraceae bacterium]|nr:polysaccharide deacetylase family protein [Steroidobacteraceae bacterium]
MTLLRLLAPCSGGRVRFRLQPRRQLALTFDDGPHPDTTPPILDALAAAGAHATFFVQGSAAATAPHIIRRAHSEGHCIASHGMTHVSARRQPAAEAVANATQCHDLLQQVLGAELPRLYRPPYGELSLGALRGLLASEFRLEFWSRDSLDSFVDSAAELRHRFTQSPPADGDILLFHDDYRLTAEALPDLLRQIRAAGFATVRMDGETS